VAFHFQQGERLQEEGGNEEGLLVRLQRAALDLQMEQLSKD
jgi:hypothetical protein